MIEPGLLVVCLLAQAPPSLDADLRAADPAVRLRAVRHIERRGAEGSPDAAHLAALAPLLREHDLTLRGLAALAIHRHIAACKDHAPADLVAALIERLDDDRHVAAFCGRSLVTLGPLALPEVREWLRPVKASPRPASERLLALKAGRLLAEDDRCREAIVRFLWRTLSDDDPTVADRAWFELDRLQQKHSRIPVADLAPVRAALASSNERIRSLAAAELAASKGRAFASVISLLKSDDTIVRHEAAGVLEALLQQGVGPKPAETFELLQGLHRPRTPEWGTLREKVQRIFDVQFAAVAEIAPQVDHCLRLAKETPDGWDIALPKLKALQTPALRVLEERLEAEDPETQQFAAEALLELRDAWEPSARALEALGTLLASPREKTARAAAYTLRYCVRPSLPVPPRLLEALGNTFRQDHATIRALGTIALAACGLQAEKELLRLLRDPDPHVQFHAVLAIYWMARQHRLDALGTERDLARLTLSPDHDVVEAAAAALAQFLERPEEKP